MQVNKLVHPIEVEIVDGVEYMRCILGTTLVCLCCLLLEILFFVTFGLNTSCPVCAQAMKLNKNALL